MPYKYKHNNINLILSDAGRYLVEYVLQEIFTRVTSVANSINITKRNYAF